MPHQPPARQMLLARCSRLPDGLTCPASLTKPAYTIEAGDDAPAQLGNSVHDALATVIESGAAGICFDADDETNELYGMAWRAWLKIRDYFPDPIVNHTFRAFEDRERGVTLTGTCDLCSVAPDGTNLILDWKSGWGEADHSDQLKGYAWLSLQETDAAKVRCTVLRIRKADHETFEITRDEAAAWWDATCRRLHQRDLYHPGEHCRYCPRRNECPALDTYRRNLAWLVPQISDQQAISVYGPAELRDILVSVRILAQFAEDAQSHIRTLVDAAGGRLVDEAGNGLELVGSQRREIDAEKGWPVLQDCLRLADAVTVRLGQLEKAFKAQCDRGEKEREWVEFLRRLEACGGIERRTVRSLKVVAAKQLEGVPY